MKPLAMLLLLVAVVLNAPAFAKTPFDGNWTLNVEQSHFAPDIISWRDAGNGDLTFVNLTQRYTFKPDGKPYKTPSGDQQSTEKISDNIYRIITRRNESTVVLTEMCRVSSDGKTLELDGTGTRNGKPFRFLGRYARTSSGIGLVGDWKNVEETKMSPETLSIQTDKDEVTMTFVPDKAADSELTAKWDGRDYPYRGATVAVDATMALRKTGPREFQLIHKIHGRVADIQRFKLASDGQSMLDRDISDKGQELLLDVWDKR